MAERATSGEPVAIFAAWRGNTLECRSVRRPRGSGTGRTADNSRPRPWRGPHQGPPRALSRAGSRDRPSPSRGRARGPHPHRSRQPRRASTLAQGVISGRFDAVTDRVEAACRRGETLAKRARLRRNAALHADAARNNVTVLHGFSCSLHRHGPGQVDIGQATAR